MQVHMQVWCGKHYSNRFQRETWKPSRLRVTATQPNLKVKQTAQKSVHILFRTYILSTIYIHVQNMENKMSADERGNQTQLLFHLWGTLLRDPL